jgi:hypothetical protein
LTFYPPKKVASPFIKVLKNFFKIGRTGYQKKRNFALISKCAKVSSLAKGKKDFYRKLTLVATMRFSEKKSLGTS